MNPPSGNAASDRLAQWVHDHARAVRGYLLGWVRKPDVADDLLQEVFRRAWQAADRYREEGTPRAYLLRIADRLVIDRARRSGTEQTIDDNTWRAFEPLAEQSDPSADLTRKETEVALQAAMEELTAPQRRVLLLRYYGDLSFAAIAEETGMPLGTVLSHCRRGLERLRTLMVNERS